MKVKELVGSLMTYELHLHRRKKEKGSGIVFKIMKVEVEEEDNESDNDEHMVMLTKQFKKFLSSNPKETSSRPRSPQKNKFFNNLRQNSTTSFVERMQNFIQCHKCEGFGHIAVECANALKSPKLEGYKHKKKMRINIQTQTRRTEQTIT